MAASGGSVLVHGAAVGTSRFQHEPERAVRGGTLQPWLDRLTAEGRSAPQYRGFIPRERRELLLDHAGREAAQRRLHDGLPHTPTSTPPARNALVEVGCLMPWAVPPGQDSAPWTAAATALVREQAGIAGFPPGVLLPIMRVMHDEFQRDWD